MKNPDLNAAGWTPEEMLLRAEAVILPYPNGRIPPTVTPARGKLRVGVDLGTAYTVLVVLDEQGIPIAGEYQFTQVVRDGLVVDFIGAVDILRAMKQRVEARIGQTLTHAASGFPPGVPMAEVRATANVVRAAGMDCPDLIDEPTAANTALRISDGVIVDIGGGTTGVAVIENGTVTATADEATGGAHMSLVIAGATGLSFEAAEDLKKNPEEQSRLFPMIRPVMEKMGTIIAKHITGKAQNIVLVGGASLFPGTDTVIQEVTGIPTQVARNPLFVTPMGIALNDPQGIS